MGKRQRGHQLRGRIVALIALVWLNPAASNATRAGELRDGKRASTIRLGRSSGWTSAGEGSHSNRSPYRIIKTPAEGARVVWQFDEIGRVESTTDGAGTVVYGYDQRGRLTAVQRQGLPTVSYTYDSLDRVVGLEVQKSVRSLGTGRTGIQLGHVAASSEPVNESETVGIGI